MSRKIQQGPRVRGVILILGFQLIGTASTDLMAQSATVDSIGVRMTRELRTEGRLRLAELHFSRADRLEPGATVVLQRVAYAMSSVPGSFVIEAHVRPTRDETSDQATADRRASTVRSALIELGVPATRLFAVGIGRARTSSKSRGPVDSSVTVEVERIEIARLQ